MTPDPHTSESKPQTTRTNGRKRSAQAADTDGRDHLAAISAASHSYGSGPGESIHKGRGSGWWITFLAAVGIGALAAFSVPNQHICAADFRFAETPTSEYRAEIRKDLLNFAWNDQASRSIPTTQRMDWFVDAPNVDLLRLCLKANDPGVGLAHTHRLAAAFCDETERRAIEMRSSPSESERVLSNQVAKLETQLTKTRTALEDAMAAKPTDDPQVERSTLLEEWQMARRKFDRSREALSKVAARIDFLRNDPNPPDAIVPSEDRRRALGADESLQQDLGELTVNLTESKMEILKVWKQSSSSLDELKTASLELASLDVASVQASEDTALLVERLADAAAEYESRLIAFSTDWTGEFESLKRRPVDPMTADQLDVYRRTRSLLGDFLFQAGNRLSDIRKVVDGIEDLGSGGARYHVLHASLLRKFRALQTAHHRFEFAAGVIESQRNFQLDTALRSARGLFRRTQDRIAQIDKSLTDKAQHEALARRDAELAELESKVRSLRSRANDAVDLLIRIQEAFHVNAGFTEAHLQSSIRADLSEDWIGITESQLVAAQSALQQLEETRMKAASAPGISLESVKIIGRTVTPEQRIRVGGISAAAALLIVGIAQLWMRRRAMRPEAG